MTANASSNERLARLCLAALLTACALPALAADPSVPKLPLAHPEKERITQEIVLPASFEPYQRVLLHANVTGYLTQLTVDIGDRVTQGQLIAQLVIPELDRQILLAESRVAAARAAHRKAQSQATLRKVTHQRLASLHKLEAGAVAELDVEVAAAELQVAESQVAVAAADIRIAEAEVAHLKTLDDYRTIVAPFDAVVTRRAVDIGALVTAANGQGLVELMRTDKLRLSFEIPERLLGAMDRGQLLRFAVEAIPGPPIEAPLARLTGAMRAQTRSMPAEIDVDNTAGQFAPGMYARVLVPLARLNNVVAVPAASVRSWAGQTVVYAVRDGLVRRAPVVVLMDDGKQAVVCGDLSTSTPVVASNSFDLQDGQRVDAK